MGLTAVEKCRNDTTDTSPGINNTASDAPKVLQGSLLPTFQNTTQRRKKRSTVIGGLDATTIAKATTFPCPTLLYNGAESVGVKIGLSNVLGFVGLVVAGMIQII